MFVHTPENFFSDFRERVASKVLKKLNKTFFAEEFAVRIPGFRHPVCKQADQIARLGGYQVLTHAPYFHEFVVRGPRPPEELNRGLLAEGILGGLPLGRFFPQLADCALYCCTEMNSRAEIDRLVGALASA